MYSAAYSFTKTPATTWCDIPRQRTCLGKEAAWSVFQHKCGKYYCVWWHCDVMVVLGVGSEGGGSGGG